MTDSRPQLRAVPATPPETPEAAGETSPSRPRRGGALAWWLAAGLAGSGLGWALEAQESQQLATSLEATGLALDQARGELAAWEGHVGAARDQATALVREASDLTQRLAALEAMLADGPAVSPDTEATSTEP